VNLQLLGLPEGFDKVTRGGPAADQFLNFYIAVDRIRALEAANNPRDLRLGRKLTQADSPAPIDRVADASVGLQELTRLIA